GGATVLASTGRLSLAATVLKDRANQVRHCKCDTPVILQPVLGYRGNSNSSDLSSWNCCTDGVVWHSDFIPAKSGDDINGDVYATCAAGSVCSSWNIDTRNVTSGRSVRLSTTSDGDLTQIMAGALEVYSVDSCDEYPASGNITFTGVAVYDYRMRQVQVAAVAGDHR
ncbi:hypothetical protein, partial [Xanthomonas oryzae]|uniref:hypothetical protein n=1 Tax=Xanthomonas oryzae TaxID=347 RepID=UPI00215C58DE